MARGGRHGKPGSPDIPGTEWYQFRPWVRRKKAMLPSSKHRAHTSWRSEPGRSRISLSGLANLWAQKGSNERSTSATQRPRSGAAAELSSPQQARCAGPASICTPARTTTPSVRSGGSRPISAIARDVTRKIAGNTVLEQRFAAILHRVERVLAQQRHDRNKLYALHVLEVECLAKGRRTRSTSSASRSVSPQPTAQASCSACWLCPATPMMAIPSTPPPGRPERLTGTSIERLYVDRGST
jgi:hypothetical protein